MIALIGAIAMFYLIVAGVASIIRLVLTIAGVEVKK